MSRETAHHHFRKDWHSQQTDFRLGLANYTVVFASWKRDAPINVEYILLPIRIFPFQANHFSTTHFCEQQEHNVSLVHLYPRKGNGRTFDQIRFQLYGCLSRIHPRKLVDHHLHGQFTHTTSMLVDRRQLRRGQSAVRNIVKANHRHILRHIEAGIPTCFHRAHCRHIIQTHASCWPTIQR